MSKNMAFRTLKTFILAAPLMVACGSDSSGGNPPSVPNCADGTALAWDGTAFQCKTLPASSSTLPTCKDTEAATDNGQSITCTVRNVGGADAAAITTRLDAIDAKVVDLSTQLAAAAGGTGATAVYQGSTTVTTKGRVEKAGSDTGIAAAASLCNDAYKGSHMCTVYELYNSVNAGLFKMGTTTLSNKAWIFFPSWNEPNGTPEGPMEGTSDTCGAATYPTGDKKWTGIAAVWTTLSTGAPGFKFYGGSTLAPCNQPLPIACCK